MKQTRNEHIEAFLDEVWRDLDAGDLRPLAHYTSRYPQIREEVEAEYESCVRSSTECDAPTQECDAPTHVGWLDAILRGERSAKGTQSRDAPQDHPLRAGHAIEQYRLLSLIGTGGMGQVWLAEDRSLGGRRVALKMILGGRATERQRLYFSREARACARASHPGIVTIHGYGDDGSHPWIAMEYVEGSSTLRDVIDGVARLPEPPKGYDREIARMVAETADAMHAAHEADVIHRDLKPSNILVTTSRHPKVTDFGLARILNETGLSMTGDAAGTYYYMSPEQVGARRTRPGTASDVFSLGVVMYECLTLRRPFQGDTSQQIAQQILNSTPPGMRELRSRIPEQLVVICGKAMEKDPGRRYTTMAAFAADIRRYLSDEPILARPPGPLERASRWCRRHPAWTSAATIAVVAIAVLSTLAGLLSARSHALQSANAALRSKTAEAERSAREAQDRTRDVSRLALAEEYDNLLREQQTLWPAVPAMIDSFRSWMDRAEELCAQLPELRASYARLERDLEPSAANSTSGSTDLVDLTPRWWRTQLAALIENLERLQDPDHGMLSPGGVDPVLGWSVANRLTRAEYVRDAFAPEGFASIRWREALPAIRMRYEGLDINVQMGLLPIGPDPDSGLWEFADILTGDLPKRGEDGHLILTEHSCVVFVLLPGGTFLMGGQDSDPAGPNYVQQVILGESPVHEVQISPFFLSKYELTQGQWLLATGTNPGLQHPPGHMPEYGLDQEPETYRFPIETVSWLECDRVLGHLGMQLPSEAQWEYAARADTETAWWWGDDPPLAATRENLADLSHRRTGQPYYLAYESWDDGFGTTAPVGSLLPNPFGLHDMLGNVEEWCADSFLEDGYDLTPRVDPLLVSPRVASHTRRGGSWPNVLAVGRPARRRAAVASYANPVLGVRPARALLAAAERPRSRNPESPASDSSH